MPSGVWVALILELALPMREIHWHSYTADVEDCAWILKVLKK
jgi:hypothetical protein